jgi:hypothetical protein
MIKKAPVNISKIRNILAQIEEGIRELETLSKLTLTVFYLIKEITLLRNII